MPRSRPALLLRGTLPLLAAIPVVVFAVLLLPASDGHADQPQPTRDTSQELREPVSSHETAAKSARA